MLLFWRIRYLDTRDKQFKDRDLYLDTNSLDPVTKAAVELCDQLRDTQDERDMLRYRHLFRPDTRSQSELNELWLNHNSISTFSLSEYLEDENGRELSREQIGPILTGDPKSVLIPAGAKRHDVEFALADKPPIGLDGLLLTAGDLRTLGYFSRDLKELEASAFFVEGAGTLERTGRTTSSLQTAVTDEEIRSFVTIFRRLHMKGEPANFVKAASVFADVIVNHPVAKWVLGVAADYASEMERPPDSALLTEKKKWTFTRKRLIDVFLYTRYAHQPDEKRTRQFKECLAQVDGQEGLLTWLFLAEMRNCALRIHNAGVQIASFFDAYCKCHKVDTDVLSSLSDGHPGIGALEKREEKRERLLREKSEELAMELWKKNGRPEGGPAQFFNEAREQLKVAITGKRDTHEEAS